MITKCPCQLCNQPIEFDGANFVPGTAIACPHCGMETQLYIPHNQRAANATPAPALKPPASTKPKPYSCHSTRIVSAVFFMVGLGMIGVGFLNDSDAKNVLQQSPATFQMCCGVLVCALSAVMAGIAGIVEAIVNK